MIKKILKWAVISFVALIALVLLVGVIFEKEQVKFRNKARQTEAKILLASAYISQKSFFAEFNEYTSFINFMDLAPESIHNYKFGFANVFANSVTIVTQAKTESNTYDPEKKDSDALGLVPTNSSAATISFTQMASKYGCLVEKTKFKICAIGLPGSDRSIDVWSIDDKKNVVNETASP